MIGSSSLAATAGQHAAAYFASQAASNLSMRRPWLREAHRMGLRVSDEELREELQHGQLGPRFFPTASSSARGVRNFVQRNDIDGASI